MQPTAGSPQDTQLRFWLGFQKFLGSSKSNLGLSSAAPQPGRNLSPSCAAGIFVTVRCNVQAQQITVDLTFGKDRHSEFKMLRDSHKADIDRDLGVKAEWKEIPGQSERHIKVNKAIRTSDAKAWPEHYAWLVAQAEKLHRWGRRAA